MSYSLAALKITWLNNILIQFFNVMHKGVHSVFNNPNLSYGLTIILVTIIIRLILFPLNYKQIKSSVKMSEMQPKLQKLQERYKNNPQKYQEEMMKLYKENGVNPMGGCLPLLLQWPILIALYYVFNNLATIDPEITNVTFLGLKLMGIPTSNPGTWILPILSGVLTYISTAVTTAKVDDSPQAKQTRNMSIFMSIFITYMGFKFSTALVIYWVTNSLFQIGQTLLMKAMEGKKSAVEQK